MEGSARELAYRLGRCEQDNKTLQKTFHISISVTVAFLLPSNSMAAVVTEAATEMNTNGS